MNDREAWQAVMDKGRKQEPETKGIANRLDSVDVDSIIGTIDFFNPHRGFIRQAYYDLTTPKYRVFDWIAMLLNGRYRGYGEDEVELGQAKRVVEIMVEAYLQTEGVEGFIAHLRTVDYQLRDPQPITWTSWSGET